MALSNGTANQSNENKVPAQVPGPQESQNFNLELLDLDSLEDRESIAFHADFDLGHWHDIFHVLFGHTGGSVVAADARTADAIIIATTAKTIRLFVILILS